MKKKHPEHVNHERWLISYADFITLLFAFFVVMFASSQTDSVKVGRFVDSFALAIQWSVFTVDGKGFLDGAPSNPGVAEEKVQTPDPPKAKPRGGEFDQAKDLKGAVKKLQASAPILAGLKIEEARGELILRLPERLVFDRGKADINNDGRVALSAIADEVMTRPIKMRVEGHTDSTPIHTTQFPSNWELSTARSTAVIQFFIEKKNFEPARLSAAGYAEFHPLADNETEEGRASNRRVDLVITEALEGLGNQYLSQKAKAEKRADQLTEPTVLPPPTDATKGTLKPGTDATKGTLKAGTDPHVPRVPVPTVPTVPAMPAPTVPKVGPEPGKQP